MIPKNYLYTKFKHLSSKNKLSNSFKKIYPDKFKFI